MSLRLVGFDALKTTFPRLQLRQLRRGSTTPAGLARRDSERGNQRVVCDPCNRRKRFAVDGHPTDLAMLQIA